jgi:hypothetical protein
VSSIPSIFSNEEQTEKLEKQQKVLTNVTYWVEAFLSCWKEEYGRVAIRLADTQRQQPIPFRYNGNHTLFIREHLSKEKSKKEKEKKGISISI